MNNQPLYTFAKWKVKDGNLETVLDLIKKVVNKSCNEEGNLFYKIHQAVSDPLTILLWEGYADANAVEQHRQSEHFQNIVVTQIIPLLESREVFQVSELSFELQSMIGTCKSITIK